MLVYSTARASCVFPGTLNHKTNPPKPVKLLGMQVSDINFAKDLGGASYDSADNFRRVKNNQMIDLTNFPSACRPPEGIESLAEGLEREEMLRARRGETAGQRVCVHT